MESIATPPPAIPVCILAHNEQKHIAATIEHILASSIGVQIKIIVYANGCTDATVSIVQSLTRKHSNLHLRTIKKASKIVAWNTAFKENRDNIIVFSDGDITPEPNTLSAFIEHLKTNTNTIVVSSQYWPTRTGLSFEQKLIGLMQIPLHQDFLTGQFYAVRRQPLLEIFASYNFHGLPEGIVGEDLFIERLTPRGSLAVVKEKCFYDPPKIPDYLRYLARIRWQGEQILAFEKQHAAFPRVPAHGFLEKMKDKLSQIDSPQRLFIGTVAAIMRHCFVLFHRKKINHYKQALGPVRLQGEGILSNATRSFSTK